MFSEKDLIFLGACLIRVSHISTTLEGSVKIAKKLYKEVFEKEETEADK